MIIFNKENILPLQKKKKNIKHQIKQRKEDLSKFIPKLIETGVVRAMGVVAKLVEHSVKNLVI